MSYSYTLSETTTFTRTHAKHIAAKVATDLKRIQRFYGEPNDADIADYETEIIELLKASYLNTVTYGFRRNGTFVEPTLRYKASDLAVGLTDDDPGRIRPGANVDGASFYSYLTYTTAWNNLSQSDKDSFKSRLPFQRSGASEPAMDGYLNEDRSYSSGGRTLYRASLRSYQ